MNHKKFQASPRTLVLQKFREINLNYFSYIDSYFHEIFLSKNKFKIRTIRTTNLRTKIMRKSSLMNFNSKAWFDTYQIFQTFPRKKKYIIARSFWGMHWNCKSQGRIFHVIFWNGKPCFITFIFTKIILRRLHVHKKNCGFQFLVYNLFVSCTYFIINSISKPFVARTSKLDQMFVVLNFTEIQFLCY